MSGKKSYLRYFAIFSLFMGAALVGLNACGSSSTITTSYTGSTGSYGVDTPSGIVRGAVTIDDAGTALSGATVTFAQTSDNGGYTTVTATKGDVVLKLILSNADIPDTSADINHLSSATAVFVENELVNNPTVDVPDLVSTLNGGLANSDSTLYAVAQAMAYLIANIDSSASAMAPVENGIMTALASGINRSVDFIASLLTGKANADEGDSTFTLLDNVINGEVAVDSRVAAALTSNFTGGRDQVVALYQGITGYAKLQASITNATIGSSSASATIADALAALKLSIGRISTKEDAQAITAIASVVNQLVAAVVTAEASGTTANTAFMNGLLAAVTNITTTLSTATADSTTNISSASGLSFTSIIGTVTTTVANTMQAAGVSDADLIAFLSPMLTAVTTDVIKASGSTAGTAQSSAINAIGDALDNTDVNINNTIWFGITGNVSSGTYSIVTTTADEADAQCSGSYYGCGYIDTTSAGDFILDYFNL